MLEAIFEDTSIRLILLIVVVCVAILWYNIRNVSNDLSNTNCGKIKYVLVTGCDSGFGYEIALDLNKVKCKVFAGCLTESGVERFKRLKDFDGAPFVLDVRKDEDLENAKRLIEEKLQGKGRVDLL